MTNDVHALPPNLPVPVDDGACSHLLGSPVPGIRLKSAGGHTVDLASLRGTFVLYAYPRVRSPDPRPTPEWNAIPGAPGCTLQSCRFRDTYQDFFARNVSVFGVSTQDPSNQRLVVSHLQLPFELLSDYQLELAHGWALPTFVVDGEVLLKRLTLIVCDGLVTKVFYPVFPPTTNADDVLRFLSAAT
jgi:peroxiredoxin